MLHIYDSISQAVNMNNLKWGKCLYECYIHDSISRRKKFAITKFALQILDVSMKNLKLFV
jgi:hypothetical protein